MTINMPLSPPAAFRQRVVAPEFLQKNEALIRVHIDTILRIANGLNYSSASEWSEQLIKLQKAGKLPAINENLVAATSIGIAVAKHEASLPDFDLNSTLYISHACMAMLAYSENPAELVVQSAAIDGGYYIQRTSSNSEALAESFSRGL
jgi:hypothetical protein